MKQLREKSDYDDFYIDSREKADMEEKKAFGMTYEEFCELYERCDGF